MFLFDGGYEKGSNFFSSFFTGFPRVNLFVPNPEGGFFSSFSSFFSSFPSSFSSVSSSFFTGFTGVSLFVPNFGSGFVSPLLNNDFVPNPESGFFSSWQFALSTVVFYIMSALVYQLTFSVQNTLKISHEEQQNTIQESQMRHIHLVLIQSGSLRQMNSFSLTLSKWNYPLLWVWFKWFLDLSLDSLTMLNKRNTQNLLLHGSLISFISFHSLDILFALS